MGITRALLLPWHLLITASDSFQPTPRRDVLIRRRCVQPFLNRPVPSLFPLAEAGCNHELEPLAPVTPPRFELKSATNGASVAPLCADHFRQEVSSVLSSTVLLGSVLALLLAPLPSHAAYGPSGAAVISPAIVKPVTVDQFLQLSDKKQLQYENGVKACFQEPGGKQCKPISLVDSLIKDLNDIILQRDTTSSSPEDASDASSDDKQGVPGDGDSNGFNLAERRRARENEIEERDRLLARQKILQGLGAQPGWVSFAAAFLASTVSTAVMHPLDTLKTRIMSGDRGRDDGGENEMGGSSDPGVGIASLYEGITANIAKEALPSALYLGIYESCRTALSGVAFFDQYPIASYLLAGACGELVGSIIRAPAEAVKTRIQTTGATLTESLDSVIRSSEGRRNTFMAWSVSILRDVPAGAIQITVFEIAKQLIVESSWEVDVNTLLSEALIGASGGGFGAFLTTPSDVATTTIISGFDEGGSAQRLSAGDILSRKFSEEGVPGFFTGSLQRTVYWAMAVGIFLSCYCSFRQYALIMGI